jgi:DNA-directed RNA polymerase subunit K/omega
MSDFEDNNDYLESSDSEDEDNYGDVTKSQKIKSNNLIKNKTNMKPTISDYDDDDDDIADEDDDGSIEENNGIILDEDVVDVDIDDDDDDIDDDDGDDDDDDDDDDDVADDDDMDDDENGLHGGAGNQGNETSKSQKKQQKNIKFDIHPNNDNDDDYDEDDDEQNENYLQKFEKELTKNYIMDFHPECLSHNYDEVKALSKVTRDEFNIIIDPLHKTIPFLTKYEETRILGQRAKQIECGAKPLVKVPENIIDGYIIAKLELEQKRIPFIIRRPIPGGGSEYWHLQDLEILTF